MNNAVRKKISHALLAEALSLDYDVLDLDELDDLPTTLPIRVGLRKSRADFKDLQVSLEHLMDLGCKERVLFWCLERLSPAAERIRAGEIGKWSSGDEDTSIWIKSIPPLATRADMAAVVNKVQAAAKIIHKFRKELLLAADAQGSEHPLPEGLFSEGPHDVYEAMAILTSSLSWVKQVAKSWQTPHRTQLVKSTGILYLLTYVWMHSKTPRPSKRQRMNSERSRKIIPERMRRNDADTVANIANLTCGLDITAQDLIDKLQDFHQGYPDLHGKMVTLLNNYEAVA